MMRVLPPTPTSRTTRAPLRVVVGLVLVGGLAGCGGLFGGKSEPIQSYMFAPRAFTDTLAATPSERVLLLASVKSIGYDSQQMAYAMRPYERTYYAFSRWADTPPRMLEPVVAQAMEASGLFRAVVDTTSSVPADYRLDLNLLVVQHEFHTARSQGNMVIRAQLNSLATNAIIGTRVFQGTATAPSENPYGGVLAINIVLENILVELVTWVAESIAAEPQAASTPGDAP
jgi:cholesterol transport system auxiliary component